MDSTEFKKDFIESIKTAAAVTGEGSCASFVDNMAQYLIDAEALSCLLYTSDAADDA